MSLLRAIVKRTLASFGYDIIRSGERFEQPFNLLALVLKEYLRHHQEEFFFVQIGAGDGVQSDNLHPLICQFALKGLLVEPLPEAFQALQRSYAQQPQLRFENCAIDTADGHRTLYRFRKNPAIPNWAHGMASFDKAHLTKFRNTAHLGPWVEAVEVPTLTCASLLRKHGITRMSLLQVDAEGYDYEILKMMFSAGLFPPLINYEHEHLSGRDHLACKQQLVAHGYQFIRHGRDMLAIRAASSLLA